MILVCFYFKQQEIGKQQANIQTHYSELNNYILFFNKINCKWFSSASKSPGNSPRDWFFAVDRPQPHIPLLPAQLCQVACFEEFRRKIDEPPAFHGGHIAHVLLDGQHQLVVDHLLGLNLEDRLLCKISKPTSLLASTTELLKLLLPLNYNVYIKINRITCLPTFVGI